MNKPEKSVEKEVVVQNKSVSDLIFDKFAELVRGDAVFNGVASELDVAVRAEKPKKADIIKILQKQVPKAQGKAEEAAK